MARKAQPEIMLAARLNKAVAEMQQSPDLRFFLRHYLGMLGLNTSPFSSDPLEMARQVGQQEAAHLLQGLLSLRDPAFWPSLLLEAANEEKSVLASDDAQRSDGGNAFRSTARNDDTSGGNGYDDSAFALE